MIAYLLNLEVIDRLGVTLIHFLWQGALLSLATAVGRSFWKTSRNRYRLALAALAGMLLCPVVTFALLAPEPPHSFRPAPLAASPIPQNSSSPESVTVEEPGQTAHPDLVPAVPPTSPIRVTGRWNWRGVIAFLWMGGVLALAWRLPVGLGQLRAIQIKATAIEAPDALAALRRAANALGVTRAVALLTHASAKTPVTFGWLKPVILLPPAALAGLTVEQLEAILAHELAHILRCDYLVSLLQVLAESLLFFHPGVWWISRQLDRERELACDDLVVAKLGNRIAYAKALSLLAAESAIRLAPAASGGRLLSRIRRILIGEPVRSGAPWRLWLAIILSVLVVTSAGVFIAQAQEEKARTEKSDAERIAAVRAQFRRPAPHGIVRDPVGQPLAGARVTIFHRRARFSADNAIQETVTTNGEGRFQAAQPLQFETYQADWEGEEFSVIASHPAYGLQWHLLQGVDPVPDSYDFQLSPPRSLRFRLMDGDQPVSGVRVFQSTADRPGFGDLRLDQDIGVASAVSGADGWVEVSGLPPGPCSFKADAASGYSFGFWSFFTGGPKDPPNEIAQIRKVASVKGRLLDPDGRPAQDATVVLKPVYPASLLYLVRSNAAGEFHFPAVYGKNQARLRKDDTGEYDLRVRDARFLLKPQRIKLGPGEALSGLECRLERGVQAGGIVRHPETGEGLPGVAVSCDLDGERFESQTDELGRFAWRLPKGGHASFRVDGAPAGSYRSRRTSSGEWADATLRGDTQVELVANGIRKLVEVRGVAKTADGLPVSNAQVTVEFTEPYEAATGSLHPNFGNTTTGEDGRFVLASAMGDAAIWVRDEKGTMGAARSLRIPKEGLDAGVLTLQATRPLEVAITGATGEPLRETKVTTTLQVQGLRFHWDRAERTTDPTGVLRIPNALPGADYQLGIGDQQVIGTVRFTTEGQAVPPALQAVTDWTFRCLDRNGVALIVDKMIEFRVAPAGWREEMRLDFPGQLPGWGQRALQKRLSPFEFAEPQSYIALLKPKAGDTFETFVTLPNHAGPVYLRGQFPEAGHVIDLRSELTFERPAIREVPDILPSDEAEVAGRVVDAAGKPVQAQVFIIAMPRILNGKERSVMCDAEGVFRIPNLKGSRYEALCFEAAGYETRWIGEPAPKLGFEIWLGNRTRFRGKLPFGPASIRLKTNRSAERTHWRRLTLNLKTADDGGYDFLIESGIYDVEIRGAEGQLGWADGVALQPGSAMEFPITDFRPAQLTLTVLEAGTERPVEGLVYSIPTDYPLALRHQEIMTFTGMKRTTDAKGQVHWDALMPGVTGVDPETQMGWRILEPGGGFWLVPGENAVTIHVQKENLAP